MYLYADSDQFVVDQGSQIGVFDPELPPLSEVHGRRYEYAPLHLTHCQVMPEHLFFHFFYDPIPHYNDKWMRRFPKKLRHSIFDSTDQLPVGWGIHILESPNYHMISMALFIGLALSGLLAVLWAVLTKDVQGAFSIGGYAVALQTAWMTAMYFKWSQ